MDLASLLEYTADMDCGNHTAFVQGVYGLAVSTVASSLKALAMQINTFKADHESVDVLRGLS